MPATENLRSEMDHLHGKKNVLIEAGLVDLSFLFNNNYVSTTITPSSLCKKLTKR
jgi:hypothetical protein